jgi:small-conductance mechanosensitive channel
MKSDDTTASGVSLALKKVHGWSSDFFLMLPNIAVGIVIFALFVLVSWGLRRTLSAYFNRTDRMDLGRLISDFLFWAIIVLGFLVFLTIIIPSLKPVDLLGSIGFGSLAFGFAFKDILQNWLSGLLILLRLPFRRGDQIRIGDVEGTVQAIEPRATIIRTYDGRDTIVPNTTIYTGIVTIQTSQPSRRVEIDFTVGYAYNIRRITDIIQNALKPIEEIIADPPPQILCWELGAKSLGVKVRWWIKSERAQEVISRARVIQAIKEAFDANDIDPTDPQLIYYQEAKMLVATERLKEGKKASAPPPEVIISKSDPEAKKTKLDSKGETMLPEE